MSSNGADRTGLEPGGDYDVVVVGGGITGLAAAYEAKKRGQRVLLLEASSQCGGVMRTHYQDGYIMEEAAESVLSIKPACRQLCQELGMADQLIGTQPEYRGTMVVKDGRLHPVPEGFRLLAPQEVIPFLRSPVFSWWGKIRMGLEFFVPQRRDPSDESLGDFVRRRFGRECLIRMAQPMAAGIFTADPDELSMQAAMPQFVELERRYGSVLRGFLFTATKETATASGPRYTMFQTLRDGMGRLPERLLEYLGASAVRCDSPVDLVAPALEGTGWEIRSRGVGFRAQRLVVALSANVAARICRGFAPLLADELGAIKYLSSATVNLVYPLSGIAAPTKVYGFVVPAVEHRDILACTYSHRKYSDRCPPDAALLRTYIGGAHNPAAAEWSDQKLIERSHEELRHFLGITADPVIAHVARAIEALPVYQVGHLQRVARIEQVTSQFEGLALAGNYFTGVGIPDCIALGRQKVEKLLS